MRFSVTFLCLALVSCTLERREMDVNKEYQFLALGDSYTIGEAVKENERWPMQLANRLKNDSIKLKPTILATTGWTTDELMTGIIKADDLQDKYDLVSLLIGVNNQYRGYDEDQYEKEFKILLDNAIQLAKGNPHHVFVVSIPDYSVTPFVVEKMLDSAKIAHELDSYNAIAQKIATLRDISFIDITEISRQAKNDPDLIAEDGLHPSGKMYKQWVDAMYNQVYGNLSSR